MSAFAVPAANPNGPSDPINLGNRGADPLILLPAGSFFLNVNAILVPQPGGVAAVPNCIRNSDAMSIIGQAFRFDAAQSARDGEQIGSEQLRDYAA